MRAKLMKLAITGFIFILFSSPAYGAGSLNVMEMRADSNTPGLTFRCSYPRIAGIQDETQQQKLNVIFREMAMIEKAKAEQSAKDSPQAGIEGSYSYEITRNREGILSIAFSGVINGEGYSRSSYSGVTVDTVTGKTYKLGDLFFDKTDFPSVIKGEIEKQISLNGSGQKLPGSLENISNFTRYYLTEDSLVILPGFTNVPEDSPDSKFAITLKSLEGSLKPSLRLST